MRHANLVTIEEKQEAMEEWREARTMDDIPASGSRPPRPPRPGARTSRSISDPALRRQRTRRVLDDVAQSNHLDAIAKAVVIATIAKWNERDRATLMSVQRLKAENAC